MFRIESEKEFLNAFRPRDRKHVEVPKDVSFPLFVRDYYSWVDPTGVRVFLLLRQPGSKHLTGIAFRRDQHKPPANMCDWCHSWGSAEQVGLLTADLNSKKRVGVNACLDLRCKEKLEDASNRSGGNTLQLTKELVERMARFLSEALGITDDVRDPA